MDLKIALYTTSNTDWSFEEASESLKYIEKTEGLTGVSIKRFKVKLPKKVPIVKDSDGDNRLDFNWLKDNVFTESGYNVYALHISRYERGKLGISKRLGGFYNTNRGDNSMEFVVIANKGHKARGYPFSEFTRIFLHELAHGFDHWTKGYPNITTHHYDYDLKQIHLVYEKEHSFVRWGWLKKLAVALGLLVPIIKQKNNPMLTAARNQLGKDASPKDLVSDELGCAESVTNIIKSVLPDWPIITGTWTLWDRLKQDTRFKRVTTPEAGDIVISPTGTVASAPFVGHVGIVGEDGTIMSNNSSKGIFEENYTIDSWNKRWGKVGYPVYFFRLV